MRQLFIFLWLCGLIAILLSSCTVTKSKHFEHKQSDTSASFDEKIEEIRSSHTLVDTAINTDADTLSGHADVQLETDTAVIESDNQQIIVTKQKGKKGVDVRAVAKPKTVTVKIDKQETSKITGNKTSKITSSHNDKLVVKDKKTSYAWYVYAVPVVLVLCVIAYVVWWLRKTRLATKLLDGK